MGETETGTIKADMMKEVLGWNVIVDVTVEHKNLHKGLFIEHVIRKRGGVFPIYHYITHPCREAKNNLTDGGQSWPKGIVCIQACWLTAFSGTQVPRLYSKDAFETKALLIDWTIFWYHTYQYF